MTYPDKWVKHKLAWSPMLSWHLGWGMVLFKSTHSFLIFGSSFFFLPFFLLYFSPSEVLGSVASSLLVLLSEVIELGEALPSFLLQCSQEGMAE